MPSLELTNDQIIELVQQLPPEQSRSVLLTLAQRAESGREQRMARAEEALRRLADQQGRQWDLMTEEEREDFVNELIHEDRPCR